MDASRLTVGQVIDGLITADLRCWFAQEDIMNPDLSDEERLSAAIKAQESNARRSDLIRAIDKLLGEETTVHEKTYKRTGQ